MNEKTRENLKMYIVPIKKVEEILPDTFEYLKEKFRDFVEDPVNSTNAEDYLDWRKYGYVDIVYDNGKIEYIPYWPKKKNPGDDLPWAYDKVEDIEEEVMKEIEKYRVA